MTEASDAYASPYNTRASHRYSTSGYSSHRRATSNVPQQRPHYSSALTWNGNGYERTPSLTSLSSLQQQNTQQPHPNVNYRDTKTPPAFFSTHNARTSHRNSLTTSLGYRGYGAPGGTAGGGGGGGDHRSYSLTSEPDHSPYSNQQLFHHHQQQNPTSMQRERSRRGPGSRSSYQRASSWSQAPGDYTRGYESHRNTGRRLSVDMCSGPTYGPEGGGGPSHSSSRATHHRHSIHGIPPSMNDRARTYSMTSVRSEESGQRNYMTYPNHGHYQNQQQQQQQPHFYNNNIGQRPGRPPIGSNNSQPIQDSQMPPQDPYASLHRTQIHNDRPSSIVRPASAPFPLQPTNQVPPSPGNGPGNGGRRTASEQMYEQERQQRVSRRSSYSKLLGIPSEVNQTDGAGFEVAHESFRTSAYSWDQSALRMSSLNLCIEGGGTAGEGNSNTVQSGNGDGQWIQEERKKLSQNEYTTTLDATTRPYTPDKFITANVAGTRDNEGKKAGEKANGGVSGMSSSIWRLGRTKSSSPKLEGNEIVDAGTTAVAAASGGGGITPSLSDEEIKTSSGRRDGKRLLKRFRPRKSRSSLDLSMTHGDAERVYHVRKNRSSSLGKLDGLISGVEAFSRGVMGTGGEHGDNDAKKQIGMDDTTGPHTSSTTSGPTAGVGTSTMRPPSSKDLVHTISHPSYHEVDRIHTKGPRVLGIKSSDNKFVAYLREKFTGLRRVITVSGGSGIGDRGVSGKEPPLVKIKSTPNSTLKYKLVAVKGGKSAAVSAATTEVLISGHKRIPSRSNTPVANFRRDSQVGEVGGSAGVHTSVVEVGQQVGKLQKEKKGKAVENDETGAEGGNGKDTTAGSGNVPLISFKKMWMNTKDGWGMWDDIYLQKKNISTGNSSTSKLKKRTFLGKVAVGLPVPGSAPSLQVRVPGSGASLGITPPKTSTPLSGESATLGFEKVGGGDGIKAKVGSGFEVVGGRGAGRAWGSDVAPTIMPRAGSFGRTGGVADGDRKLDVEVEDVQEKHKDAAKIEETSKNSPGVRLIPPPLPCLPKAVGLNLSKPRLPQAPSEKAEQQQANEVKPKTPTEKGSTLPTSPLQKQTTREVVWGWISGGAGGRDGKGPNIGQGNGDVGEAEEGNESLEGITRVWSAEALVGGGGGGGWRGKRK